MTTPTRYISVDDVVSWLRARGDTATATALIELAEERLGRGYTANPKDPAVDLYLVDGEPSMFDRFHAVTDAARGFVIAWKGDGDRLAEATDRLIDAVASADAGAL